MSVHITPSALGRQIAYSRVLVSPASQVFLVFLAFQVFLAFRVFQVFLVLRRESVCDQLATFVVDSLSCSSFGGFGWGSAEGVNIELIIVQLASITYYRPLWADAVALQIV